VAAGVDVNTRSGILWKRAALEYTYRDVWRLIRDIKDADFEYSSISMKFECEVPAVISLGDSQLGARKEQGVDEVLLNHVVLVKRPSTDGSNKQVLGVEGLTCLEYVKRRWGPLGEQALRDVSSLCKLKPGSWLHHGKLQHFFMQPPE